MKVTIIKTRCKTLHVWVGASGVGDWDFISLGYFHHLSAPRNVLAVSFACVLGDLCGLCVHVYGGHTHLCLYTGTRRGHQALLYHFLPPFRQSLSLNLQLATFWLGLACQKAHAPLGSSILNPVLGLQAHVSTARVYVGAGNPNSGPQVCARVSHLSRPVVSDFLRVRLTSKNASSTIH